MKAFLYKAKGALALALAMSMFCPQVFAAEALSAEQQGVQAAPVVELTEEELAAMALPQLTVEEALAKAIKHSASLKDLEDTLDYLKESDEKIYDRIGSVKIPSYEYKPRYQPLGQIHLSQPDVPTVPCPVWSPPDGNESPCDTDTTRSPKDCCPYDRPT